MTKALYLHIPFCARKCAYCDFLSAPASREIMDRYVEALKQEIRSAEELAERYRVSTLFFGGGTPSLLEGQKLAEILETLSQVMPVEAGAEITVECNPGTLTEDKLDAYRMAGVNRLSIGLQSADDRETMDAVAANVSANLLGLGNAATPLGLEAARRMARRSSGVASDSLCMLVVCNTASIQLIPATVASVRAAAGSAEPFDILPAVWLASGLSVGVGVLACKVLARLWRD